MICMLLSILMFLHRYFDAFSYVMWYLLGFLENCTIESRHVCVYRYWSCYKCCLLYVIRTWYTPHTVFTSTHRWTCFVSCCECHLRSSTLWCMMYVYVCFFLLIFIFDECRIQDMAGDPFGLLLKQRIIFLGGEVSFFFLASMNYTIMFMSAENLRRTWKATANVSSCFEWVLRWIASLLRAVHHRL